MSDPWVAFYPSDWLAGTRGLSPAETGIYITLVAMMYERQEPLADSRDRLARFCNCATGAFHKALDALLSARKIIETDRGLWNERVEIECGKRRVLSENGSAAAQKRWAKHAGKIKQKQATRNADASDPQCESDANHNHNHNHSRKRDTDVSRAKARIPENWHPGDAGWAYAVSQGFPEDLIDDEIAGFRAYWLDRTDRDGRKSAEGWVQCWQSHCRRNSRRFGRPMAGRQDAGRGGPGGSLASIAAWRRSTGAV